MKNSMMCQAPQNSLATLRQDKLEKFTKVIKAMSKEEMENLPLPDPNCDCAYCRATQLLPKNGMSSD